MKSSNYNTICKF